MNIKVLLIYQAFKGKFAKGEVATQYSPHPKDLKGHKGQIRVTLTERSRAKVKQHLTLEVVV